MGNEMVLGYEEIFGDDNAELASRAAAARAAGGKLLVDRKPQDYRRQPLPLPATPVNAGITSPAITQTSQRIFRMDRFGVPSEVAPSFTIDSLAINQEQQFVAAGVIAATLFSEVAVGTHLQGATAGRGSTVAIVATNTSGVNLTIRPCLFGPAVM